MQKKIFIYFSTPRSIFWPLSFLIRFIESPERFSLWHSSHASIKVEDNVYEAIFFIGVRKIPFNEWLFKNKINRIYVVASEDQTDIKSFLEGFYWRSLCIFRTTRHFIFQTDFQVI